MNANHITIIGGGCSGTLLLIQLIRQAVNPLKVTLVNSGFPTVRGIAYSTDNINHLLNVRAGRMSAFPDDPLHFVKWIEKNSELEGYHRADLSEQFIPRKIYGNYLEELLQEHLQQHHEKIKVTFIWDEVLDLETNDNEYTVLLKSGTPFTTEKVILCTGNNPPISLPGKQNLAADHRIAVNPWEKGILENLDSNQSVLILGSSLTMADTMISLISKKITAPVFVLSRHGQLPMKHPVTRETHHTVSHFEPAADLQTLYHQVKLRIRQAYASGNWHEPVLEDLRPHTQRIWQGLSTPERSRFLRHINHKWSKLRHRLPSEVYTIIENEISNDRVKLLSGELENIDTSDPLLKVELRLRGENNLQTVHVQKIINCTGPEGNFLKSGNTLLRNLAIRGLIRPCELSLGFDALPDGRLKNKDGAITKNVWTMGPGLRGVLWECTAVPEIRIQAKELATKLVA